MIHPPQAAAGPCPAAVLTDTFKGYQSSHGFISLGTAIDDILTFSGCPDRIEITVLDFAADIYFTDREGRETHQIRLQPAVAYDPGVSAPKVRGANAVAGSVARVQVVGWWQRRAAIHGE